MGNSSGDSYVVTGDFGIGDTTPDAKLDVAGDATFDGDVGIGKTPGGSCSLDVDGWACVGQLDVAGDIQATGDLDLTYGDINSISIVLSTDWGIKPNGGDWGDTSDVRLKKNIRPISGALDAITSLNGVVFEWVNPEEHGDIGASAGFIAQEVEQIFPGWTFRIEPQGADADLIPQDEMSLGVSLPMGFEAYVVEAIKELRVENEALKELVCLDHPGAGICNQ